MYVLFSLQTHQLIFNDLLQTYQLIIIFNQLLFYLAVNQIIARRSTRGIGRING